jgi:hypothetical protein
LVARTGVIGNPEYSVQAMQLESSSGALIYPPDSIFSYFIRKTYAIPSISNVLIRRRFVEDIYLLNYSFKESLFEDQALYAIICKKDPVLAVNVCWDRNRQYADSSTAVANRRGIESRAREYFLNWLEAYLTSERVIDTKLKRAIQRERYLNRHSNLQSYYRNIRRAIL